MVTNLILFYELFNYHNNTQTQIFLPLAWNACPAFGRFLLFLTAGSFLGLALGSPVPRRVRLATKTGRASKD
jgi:hypothetical protein